MYCWLKSANNFDYPSPFSIINNGIMFEIILIEMATQVKGSMRRMRKFRLVLLYLFICVNQSQGFTSIYESADHYWPMKNISDNTSLDTISYMHAEIMNGAKLNDTKLFGPAVILDGEDDWIQLRIMGDDCTNIPSECREGFTISFWLYYIDGEFLLCTGEYNSGNKGPGVKFTFEQKQFVIEISTLKYTWKITSKLIARTWVHVAFKWSTNEGIHLYLNGSAVQQQESPRKEVSFVTPKYGRGWSIGRPNNILKLTEFGKLGIAHLALWQRELTAVEVKTAFIETILMDKEKLIEMLTTPKQPTRKAQILKSSSGATSHGEMLTFQHAIIAASLLLFLLPLSLL